ncbi:efflux RND transporter permease subunit [Thalassolituus hydrocarboniclasticus]|uniref:MMPL family transporter n=1 Tax=Thalassolituus hydrocarboniclasticus TaxID=2742796 RepID=A0ABY6A8C2_9GAMM|nr:MMPL family transporter [Thalassolituus hydrocarboniclasticus]UXD87227.1 MMPL family transporter [Thalassolituus hydrocarboniclasticus]
MKTLWVNTILRYPWLLLLLLLALAFAASYGGKNLYFRGDYKVFFSQDYGPLQDFEEMQRIFNKNDNISVLVVPQNGDVFTNENLTLLAELTEQAWQTPFSSRVDSVVNFQHTWSEYDDMIVEDLVQNPQGLTPAELQRIRNIAINEPNLNGGLVAADGRAAIVNITVQIPDATETNDNTAEVIEVVDFVKAMTTELSSRYPQAAFYHTGVIPMNYSFATEGQKDMATLVPAMLGLIVLMLAVMLRSVLAMLATVVVLVLTISVTMGLGGWLGFFLSTGTINVPIVVMTLAVADCVHLIASAQFAMREGRSRSEAIRFALDLNLMPVFITSATTAVGFLTLVLSESPVLADFGILSAIGVMVAFALAVTLLPVLLLILPVQVKVSPEHHGGMEKFGGWVVRHQRTLLPVTALLMLIFGSLVTLNVVNDEATKYFAKGTDFRDSVDTQEAYLSGTQTIDWGLYSDEAQGVNDPAFIAKTEAFAEWLRQQPEVDHVTTLSDTFKRLNKNMHGDDESYYRIPQDRELAAQYLLLYEMSLPYGLDLNNQLNVDKSSTRLTSTLKNLGSKEIVALEDRARAWFAENAAGIRLAAASPGLMFSHIGETNMDSMIISMIAALILISALLVVALRSLRLGAISLIPNLGPALVGFGIWGLISGEINLGLSIVASMTLGIIVDDTVHFLAKYKRARDDGKDAEAAVRYAFSSVGRALLITTVVLVAGFSMLAFSAFRLNSDMGLATALIIFIALLVDFFFLPAFLLRLDKNNQAHCHTEQQELKPEAHSAPTLTGETL